MPPAETMAVEMTLRFQGARAAYGRNHRGHGACRMTPTKRSAPPKGTPIAWRSGCLRAAADHCASRDVKQLCEETNETRPS